MPHKCASYVPTGGSVDLRVVQGQYGEPEPGPGVLPEVKCSGYDERIGLRAAVALGIALVVSAVGWASTAGSANAAKRMAWTAYVLSKFGSPLAISRQWAARVDARLKPAAGRR